jgi:signal transduction histidine kinase
MSRFLEGSLERTDRRRQPMCRIDCRRIVQEVVARLKPVASAERKAIRFDPPERPVIVMGSRDSLRRALINVVVNGLEAMSSRQSLELDLEVEGAHAVLRVRDHGAGIPADLIDTVFEMGVSTKRNGSGIGLFVARVVIAEHGGHLRISSDPDAGTEVELVLPLAREEERPAVNKSP